MKIVIVGGGVVGMCCAILLGDKGHRVSVIDAAGDRVAPSWNNAGHIAVEQVAPLASIATLRGVPRLLYRAGGPLDLPLRDLPHWLPFGLRLAAAARPRRFEAGRMALRTLLGDALPAWHRMASRLGAPDLVRDGGHLVCFGSAASATRGRAALAAADLGTATLAEPAAGQAEALRGAIGAAIPQQGIVRIRGTGQIQDLDRLAAALAGRFHAAGGVTLHRAAALTLAGDRAQVEGEDADLVLVAAGIGSAPLMRAIGHRVPIIAERGYHLRGGAARWPETLPPVVFEDRHIIVTRYAERLQIAGFTEFAAPDARPDPGKWARLERHALDLGLPIDEPFSRWAGARPTLPDYLPAIGRSRRARNLAYAFGHQHLGLTLAPITAEAVAALVEGREGAIDLSPFDIDRFGSAA